MVDPEVATLFTIEGSQAVRLPEAFRFQGTAVRIRKEGDAVILEPLAKPGWPEAYWDRLDALGPVSDDFDVPEPLPPSPHRDAALEDL